MAQAAFRASLLRSESQLPHLQEQVRCEASFLQVCHVPGQQQSLLLPLFEQWK